MARSLQAKDLTSDVAVILDGVEYVVSEVTVWTSHVDVTLAGTEDDGPCYFELDDMIAVV